MARASCGPRIAPRPPTPRPWVSPWRRPCWASVPGRFSRTSTGARVATRGGDLRPLAGLAALVVRASRDDDPFTALLDGLGCRVHALPVMAIEPLAAAALPALSGFDKAVVVSANAARLALEQLRAAPQPAATGCEWFAVGAGSAAPLRAAGFSVTCPDQDATSEGLLALPAFAQVAGQRVLVIRGEGGRDVLRAG